MAKIWFGRFYKVRGLRTPDSKYKDKILYVDRQDGSTYKSINKDSRGIYEGMGFVGVQPKGANPFGSHPRSKSLAKKDIGTFQTGKMRTDNLRILRDLQRY